MYSRLPLYFMLSVGIVLSGCAGDGGDVEATETTTADVSSVTQETAPAETTSEETVTTESRAEPSGPIVITVAGQDYTLSGDPSAGERVFRQCTACHAFDPEVRKTGPHLQGIFGREAGIVEGVRYSQAMEESGILWTPETIGPYLLNPREVVPGTSMVVALRGANNLDDLLAYIAQESVVTDGTE